jgi:hypothetical protein
MNSPQGEIQQMIIGVPTENRLHTQKGLLSILLRD